MTEVPARLSAELSIERQREISEALIIAIVRQHELTEQALRAEAALRESEARFRLIAETTPEKIFTADRNGSITYLNPQWTAFSGFTFEQIASQGWTIIVHPDDASENVRFWQRAMETGEPYLFENRLRREDGQYRWHVTRALPLRDDGGHIVSWIGSSTDVDEAKRTERSMRLLLEDEVQLRTVELMTINEQLQGFTYSVAHDLRQQIRGISSNASILLLDAAAVLDEESKHTLARLVDSSRKLGKIVDELLNYARLGRLEPTKTTFDFTSLAAEVAEFLVENERCRPGMRIEIEPGLTAHGDPLLLRIVVENLLDNACKYSAETEAPLIEIGRKGDAFFVRDNGIGFDMRFENKLFLPFERLHRDSVYAGTGIGLANVRRIVEKHGGKVWAVGKPGEGATFYFSLS